MSVFGLHLNEMIMKLCWFTLLRTFEFGWQLKNHNTVSFNGFCLSEAHKRGHLFMHIYVLAIISMFEFFRLNEWPKTWKTAVMGVFIPFLIRCMTLVAKVFSIFTSQQTKEINRNRQNILSEKCVNLVSYILPTLHSK